MIVDNSTLTVNITLDSTHNKQPRRKAADGDTFASPTFGQDKTPDAWL